MAGDFAPLILVPGRDDPAAWEQASSTETLTLAAQAIFPGPLPTIFRPPSVLDDPSAWYAATAVVTLSSDVLNLASESMVVPPTLLRLTAPSVFEDASGYARSEIWQIAAQTLVIPPTLRPPWIERSVFEWPLPFEPEGTTTAPPGYAPVVSPLILEAEFTMLSLSAEYQAQVELQAEYVPQDSLRGEE